MDKIIVQEQIPTDIDEYIFEGDIFRVSERLAQFGDELKRKHPNYISFNIAINGMYESIYFDIMGTRYKTDVEYSNRMKIIAKKEARERKRYELLKQKYE